MSRRRPWELRNPLYEEQLTPCVICKRTIHDGDFLSRLGWRHCFHRDCYEVLAASSCKQLEAEIKLQDARETVRQRNIQVDILQDKLELTKSTVQFAHRLREDLEDQLAVAQHEEEENIEQLKRCKRDKKAPELLQNVQVTLAQMGCKCARLAADPDISTATLAHAALGQHRRVVKKLGAKLQQAAAERSGLADKIARLETQVCELTSATVCAQQQAAAEKQRVSDMSDSLQNSDRLVRTTFQQLEQLAAENDRLKGLLNKTEQKTVRAKEKCQALWKEKEAVTKQLGGAHEICGQLLLAKESAENDLSTCRRSIAALVVELEEVREKAPMCCICMDARDMIVFLPCGDACVCRDCSGLVTNCPMCRGKISSRQPVYLSVEA